MKRVSSLIGLLLVSGYTNASDLLDLGYKYPFIASPLPSELKEAAPKNSQVYSTDDFKMSKIKTVLSAELIATRGMPDMRCKSKEMKECILLYGASDGAVSFTLNEGYKTLSVGVIYNKGGSLSGEIIK